MRVDLFTHIHKGIRKGLFNLGEQAGATDWTDPVEADRLAARWGAVRDVLISHTEHEDRYIFRLLDGDEGAATLPDDEHRDLDDLLADLDERFDALRTGATADDGLEWYRDLNRYIATMLQHLHIEETVVMPALWRVASDEELLRCRAEFLADTPESVMATTGELLAGSLDRRTQQALGLPAPVNPITEGVAS